MEKQNVYIQWIINEILTHPKTWMNFEDIKLNG